MLKDQFEFIDLTHPLSSSTPAWDEDCGFCMETHKSGVFHLQTLSMPAGIGTHMDAPSHCIEGAASITDFPLEELIVPLCVIDVSTKADALYAISTADIEENEKKYGKIPSGSLVIAHTGWSRFWNDPIAYLNRDEKGQRRFPSFSEDAAKVLVEKNSAGIGIDTLSPDCFDLSYPVHKIVLGAGKFILENVANLSFLPARGAFALVLPLPILGGAEAPIRLIGIVRK